ncbi:hypothetical protein M404DRAFT_442261 [Pisolithus tinctorius Marx 270]|uniref:Uncharacterized protein n=1 Tax=Pisolithus tinctorius Marx 270 TaxID=870435 RepID=A0A0C3KB60_PISTI|nr:hypothetical protein M404DRAFT_442261 [Pisolithus tinctorius Marx 270]
MQRKQNRTERGSEKIASHSVEVFIREWHSPIQDEPTPSIRLFFVGALPPSSPSLARLLLGFLEGDTSLKFGGTVVNALSEKLGVRPNARPRRLLPIVLDERGVDGRRSWSPPGPAPGAEGEPMLGDGPAPGPGRCSANELALAFREDVRGVDKGESREVEGVHNFTITSGSSGATSSSCCCSSGATTPSDGWSIFRICR